VQEIAVCAAEIGGEMNDAIGRCAGEIVRVPQCHHGASTSSTVRASRMAHRALLSLCVARILWIAAMRTGFDEYRKDTEQNLQRQVRC
jgi:hypothetical protein